MDETQNDSNELDVDSINSQQTKQKLVDDLTNSLDTTIADTVNLLDNIILTIDKSIEDEVIRDESKMIVSNIRKELTAALSNTINKVSESVILEKSQNNFINNSEEE